MKKHYKEHLHAAAKRMKKPTKHHEKGHKKGKFRHLIERYTSL